jgi:hypothetical protein
MRKTCKNKKYSNSKTKPSSKSRKMYKRRRVGGGGMHPLIPSPVVGSSYDGRSGNYYSLNKYPSDVQLLLQNGGKRKRSRKRKYRSHGGSGSSIIPSQLSYGVGNFYDKLFGYHHAVNPSPLEGQLIHNTYFKPSQIY